MEDVGPLYLKVALGIFNVLPTTPKPLDLHVNCSRKPLLSDCIEHTIEGMRRINSYFITFILPLKVGPSLSSQIT